MIRARIFLMVVVFAIGCEAPGDEVAPSQSASEQLTADYGDVADPAAIDRTLQISKTVTLEARSSGIYKMVSALKRLLDRKGIDSSSLDEIEDFTLGHPLPGKAYLTEPTDETSGISSRKQALVPNDNPNKKYYDCPPIDMQGDESCAELVDAALLQVKASVDALALQDDSRMAIEKDSLIGSQSRQFRDYAETYLSDLALSIHRFGIEVAAIRAEYTLRDAGVCDHEVVDGEEIARLRGIEEAEIIIRELVGRQTVTLAPQGEECLKIGPTGRATALRIEKVIEEYIEEHPMCNDISRTNPAKQLLDKARREGINRGIDAYTTTTWIAMFRNGRLWKKYGTNLVAKIDGCQPKDQIKYTTSPLVIDLDNDGLQLTTDRVRFDLRATGQPQQVTWTDNEGFLALDLNGDGRITSGRELFGNRSICGGGERCADGAAALARYDRSAEGGNEDGRIDSRDTVFSALRIWVDANRDGISQQAELGSLIDHGVRALSLQATALNRTVEAGWLSLSLEVETERGPLTAYDVWFDNLAGGGLSSSDVH